MSVRVLSAVVIVLAVGVAVQAAETGDAAAGKVYFTQMCTQCHTAESGDGGGEIGPTLIGVMGRTAGVGDSRFAYTQALKDSKLVWNLETLDRFLADPAAAVPGTTMPMPVPVKKDRDNLIAYFQSLLSAAK